MLSEDVYLEKLADIMAWYVNFQFKIYDIDSSGKKQKSLQYMTWYKAFKDFSDQDFSAIVDGYMKENVYPPSSPTSLLEYAKKIIIEKNKGDIDKEWIYLKTLIVRHGFAYIKTIENPYDGFSPLKREIERQDNEKLKIIFNRMYSKLQNLNSNNEDFVRKEFFEEYERLIVDEIRSNVNQGKLTLGDEKLKLE